MGLIHDLKAASADIGLLDDGTIDYKDLKHGVFEIRTKEAHPRIIVVDDPSVTIVLRPHGGGTVGVDAVANTPAQMAQLQSAFQSAYSTFTQGQQDPFIQQLEGGTNDHANAQPQSAPGSVGSSTAANDLNSGGQGLGQIGGTQLALNVGGGGPSGALLGGAAPIGGITTPFTLPISAGPTSIVQWVSTSGGNWDSASNWSDGFIPGTGTTVQILQPVTVTLSSAEFGGRAGHRLRAPLSILWPAVRSPLPATSTIPARIVLDDPPLYISGSVTASGGGVVTMLGASTANVIIGVAGTGATLINFNNTISGAGVIGQGDGHLTFVNDAAGTVNADASGQPIVINTGNQTSNAGALRSDRRRARSLSTMRWRIPASCKPKAERLDVAAAVTGSGSASVSGGGTFEIGATDAQAFAFLGSGTLSSTPVRILPATSRLRRAPSSISPARP